MKKKGIIIITIGIILIIISLLFLEHKDNKKNSNFDILWTTEYQKGEIITENITKYNPSSYKKVNINKDNKLFYIIPQDVYLSRIGNNIIEYNNDEIFIFRREFVMSNDDITSMINASNELVESVEILKYELENGNVLILKKELNDEYYSEQLNLLIKASSQYSYYLYYQIENMSFSDEFINEIINSNKYQDNNKETNQKGIWHITLNSKTKKVFELNYDASKYLHDNNQYSTLVLKTDNDSDKYVYFDFYYDVLGVDETLDTSYTINNSEKIRLKDYDVWQYNTIGSDGIEYFDYVVMIDDYTKIRINYPKSLENKVDINDFLNIVYE